jgi:hypothetical protein
VVPSANKSIFQVFPRKHLISTCFRFRKEAPTAGRVEDRRCCVSWRGTRGNAGIVGANRTRLARHGQAHPLFGPLVAGPVSQVGSFLAFGVSRFANRTFAFINECEVAKHKNTTLCFLRA